ncbi:hypothetical protein ACHAPU_006243 [Fusarium lateritium]
MQSIIVASLLASAVSANSFMAHPLMKRDLLAPRATDEAIPSIDGISGECQSAILDVYQTLPTPPPAVVSDLMENPQTDPCDFTVPSSLSKDYASYSSKVVSWFGEYQDEIVSAVGECPELAQYATAIPVCASGLMGGSPSAIASGSATASGSVAPVVQTTATTAEKPVKTPGAETGEAATPTSSAGAVETNGAAREGAFIYAAAAVAGVVVAAL